MSRQSPFALPSCCRPRDPRRARRRLGTPLVATILAVAATAAGLPGTPSVPPAVQPVQVDPAAGPVLVPTIESDRVVLRWLDKSTARVDRVVTPVGATVALGGLDVTVRACRRTPPDRTPMHAAFLEISEAPAPGDPPGPTLFSGWMFASSPSLSALEHPVYDVWVLECADAPPEDGEGGTDGASEDAAAADAPDSAASSAATSPGAQ